MTICDIGESLWCRAAWSSTAPGSLSSTPQSVHRLTRRTRNDALKGGDPRTPWQPLLLLAPAPPRPPSPPPPPHGKGKEASVRTGTWDKTPSWRKPTSSSRCVTSRAKASSPRATCRWVHWHDAGVTLRHLHLMKVTTTSTTSLGLHSGSCKKRCYNVN